ncbi:hypothetical protein [Serratia fonticola]|uniref:Uncharacterized protein n=1 Tax=Serratia fonticola TaxID=47917 RepID=A0AAW3WU19_SERFO|nr:hypothetical protein [Serratia fonticola]MBC3214239.1 hypothetical protein [Serratia fonticola]NYA13630.1 hypothetical protein [Serratia fonticola]NYA35090.1 hypothetical protein [Serratia fonticola]
MAELMNWSNAPIVVADENGDRHTIPAQGAAKVAGDFSSHPYVVSGELSVDGELVAKTQEGGQTDMQKLRTRYKAIFGKSAPPAAKAETLIKKIEEWQEQQDED